MRRKMRKKGKVAALTLSVVIAASAFLVGTYAWRSVSQKALNEAKGNLNPGGRLHDDFNGLNLSSAQTMDEEGTERKVKYVYVENFTDSKRGDNIYARIRLQEYLEKGVGAGKASNDASKEATSIVAGKTIENKADWTPYLWDNAPTFRNYVTLGTGGQTDYLPTFNKDRDSLEADINGTLAGPDKSIETTADDYEDYEAYTAGTSKRVSIGIYDASGDGLDKVKEAGLDVETIISAVRNSANGRFNVTPLSPTINIAGISCTVTQMEPDTLTASSAADDIEAIHLDLDPQTTGGTAVEDIILKVEEHTAATTLDTDPSLDATSTPGIISMKDWDALPTHKKCGNFWVYDSEGWLYWANPIEPETATGCLLNSIAVNDTKPEGSGLAGEEYYYGLNVVAQFATAGDWGEAQNQTGFYKDGLTPEGKKLLDFVSNPLDPEDIYGVAVTLKDPIQVVTQGSKVAFLVTVTDKVTGKTLTTDAADVRWEIERGGKGKTVTIHDTAVDENGILTIAENEADTAVTVKAIYQYDAEEPMHTVEGSFTIEIKGELSYSIMIEPQATTEVTRGENITFTANVNKQIADGTPEATTDGSVSWSVVDAETGNALSGTTTAIDANGKLTVDFSETAKVLKIIAIYTVDYEDESGASQGNKQWTAEKTITLNDCSYTMATISAAGTAEPGKTIQYKTSVTRTNGTTAIGDPINSGNGSGIIWTLDGKPTDMATTIDPQTGILTIGSSETNASLTVKASFKDPLNPKADGSANIEKTTPVGSIVTTTYVIEVSRDGNYTADLVQGDIVTYSAKVKRTNGTQIGTYVTNPNVTWSTDGSANGVRSAETTSSENTVVKQTLTIGVSATGTAKLTAAFSGATTATAYNKTIVKQAYTITVTGTNSGLVQQDTAKYTAAVKKSNGQNAGTTISNPTVTWKMENNDGGTAKTDSGNTTTVTFGKSQSNKAVTLTASYGESSSDPYSTGTIAVLQYTVTLTGGSTSIVQEETGSAYTATVTKKNGQNKGKTLAATLSSSNLTWSVATPGNVGTAMTSLNYGSGTGTATAKLKVAETESATSLTVKATYKDTANNNSYESAGSSVSITKSKYSITSFSVGATKLKLGESTMVNITVKKINGTQKTVVTSAINGNLTWGYSGRSSTSTKINTSGKLEIASGETGTSVTITPTYKAANGETATTTGKTVVIDQLGTIQTNVKNTKVGNKVMIGNDEFYKVYDDGKKSLLWAVKTDGGFWGTAFGSNQQWINSNIRSYLSKTGKYVKSHSKIQEMITAGIIPQMTIYTRTSPTNATLISTTDYLFVLSEADLDGCIYASSGTQTISDTREYTAGTKLTSITTDMRKDSSTEIWSWLRSPRDGISNVAGLDFYNGNVTTDTYTNTLLGIRPAFWVNH